MALGLVILSNFKLNHLIIMKKLSFYLSIVILFIASVQLQSCKKDKDSDPQIQTTSVTALSPGKVLMKGNIISIGSAERHKNRNR